MHRFTLVRAREYDEASLEVEKDETLFDVLLTLEEAVSIDPEQFPCFRKFRTLRLARSLTYVNQSGELLPPLRIVFRVLDENEVELLYLRARDFSDEAES